MKAGCRDDAKKVNSAVQETIWASRFAERLIKKLSCLGIRRYLFFFFAQRLCLLN